VEWAGRRASLAPGADNDVVPSGTCVTSSTPCDPWWEGLILTYGYVGIGLAMFVENVFPPIPAEFVLPFAGFLVGDGRLAGAGVLAVATAGSVLGTFVFFVIGARYGEEGSRRLAVRVGRGIGLGPAAFDCTLERFRRHDTAIIFWARFLPGIRNLVSLPAGAAGMPLACFALLTLAGTLTWNAILLIAGVLLGRNWEAVLDLLDWLELVLLALACIGLALWLARRPARPST
jgi:membrane protein DedA with SNARE-associated domain